MLLGRSGHRPERLPDRRAAAVAGCGCPRKGAAGRNARDLSATSRHSLGRACGGASSGVGSDLLRTARASCVHPARDDRPRREVTTAGLRAEFRKETRLQIMLGDDNFLKLVREGVLQGEYIYRSGDLIFGQVAEVVVHLGRDKDGSVLGRVRRRRRDRLIRLVEAIGRQRAGEPQKPFPRPGQYLMSPFRIRTMSGSPSPFMSARRTSSSLMRSWNKDPTPFAWTKPANAIIKSHRRMLERISPAVH